MAIAISLMVALPLSFAASSGYGLIVSNGILYTPSVELPHDIWYIDGGGVTEFPVFVDVLAHQIQGVNGWYYHPRECIIDFSLQDLTLNKSASWMTDFDYTVLSDTFIAVNVTGVSAVSGQFGQCDNYSIGSTISYYWTGKTTNLIMKKLTPNGTSFDGYYHIGQVRMISKTAEVAENEFSVVLKLIIPNSVASSYNQHRFCFSFKITVIWKAYWFAFAGPDSAIVHSSTIIIGNGTCTGSNDSDIYLLRASDFGVQMITS